jgi:hypothetical protein
MTATIEPRHQPLLYILTTQRLDELAANGQLPPLDELPARTAAHLSAQLQLLDLPPDELAPINAAAATDAREQLKAREQQETSKATTSPKPVASASASAHLRKPPPPASAHAAAHSALPRKSFARSPTSTPILKRKPSTRKQPAPASTRSKPCSSR